ncbi:MAG: hypothetical protein ACFNP6_05630, partial [Scardovia wiggsiae]
CKHFGSRAQNLWHYPNQLLDLPQNTQRRSSARYTCCSIPSSTRLPDSCGAVKVKGKLRKLSGHKKTSHAKHGRLREKREEGFSYQV